MVYQQVRSEVGRRSRAPPRMHPPSPPPPPPRQPDHSSDPGFQERATPFLFIPPNTPDLPTPRRSANSRTQPGWGRPGRTTSIQRHPTPSLPSPFPLDRPPKGRYGVARPPRVAQVRCRGANGKDPGGPASPRPGHGTDSLTVGSGRAAAGRRGGAAAPGTAEAATRSGSGARSRCSLSSARSPRAQHSEDSVRGGGGGGGLGLRTWRLTRDPPPPQPPELPPPPAPRVPTRTRARAPAHPPPLRSLPRPPVARRAQPPPRPPPPARLACARLIRGLPRPLRPGWPIRAGEGQAGSQPAAPWSAAPGGALGEREGSNGSGNWELLPCGGRRGRRCHQPSFCSLLSAVLLGGSLCGQGIGKERPC